MKTNYDNTSMLDIVFENRNKAYGAYVLRQQSDRMHMLAVLFTVSTITLIFTGNFIKEKLHKPQSINNGPSIALQLSDVLFQRDEVKPIEKPKPTRPEEAKAKATIENPEKTVVAETARHDDSIATNDELKKYESGLTTNKEGATDGTGVSDGKGKDETFEVKKKIIEETGPIRVAEKMPQYPGGETALLAFLAKNTEFPEYEKEIGISGKVVTEFTVDEQGLISDIKILKSPGKGFDREITKSIKKLKPFSPGMQAGKPVKVRFVLPFTFALND